MRQAPTRDKISRKTKLAFSAGALEEAMLGAAGVATMVFYNQVLGVSAALCGLVYLIASCVDAISDPLVGIWSDNFKSRWGRRHPFMLFSMIPLTVSFYLMYAPPSGLSETMYFWWFLGTMVLMRLGKTFYGIPHAALGAELTDDYHERTSLFGFNTVIGAFGGILLGVAVLVVIFPTTGDYENGLLNPDRYPLLASVGVVWISLTLLVCVFGTRDQIPYLHPVDRERVDVWAFLKDMGKLVTNRSYLSVCGAWLVISSAGGILAVMGTYTYIYCYQLSTEEMTIQRFIVLPGLFIAIALTRFLTRWLDKKMTVIYCCGIGATLAGLPHVLRLIGWFPDNDSTWMLPMLFGSMFLGYLVLPVVAIVIDSQLVDIVDEHEYHTGKRSEGTVFAIRTFAIKATAGVGGLVGGFGLEYINFPDHATAEVLTDTHLNGLLFMAGPMYFVIIYTGMLFMSMYSLNERRHTQMMSVLVARRRDKSTVSHVMG